MGESGLCRAAPPPQAAGVRAAVVGRDRRGRILVAAEKRPGVAPAAAGSAPRSMVVAGPTQDQSLPALAASPGSATTDTPPPGDGADPAVAAALGPGADAVAGGFAARKAQALSLYRRNELTDALEQVQAALALRRDDELLELQAQLTREIVVQRNYDVARTANFVVLFDGYEHEEMKGTVLDILKDAYADYRQGTGLFSRPSRSASSSTPARIFPISPALRVGPAACSARRTARSACRCRAPRAGSGRCAGCSPTSTSMPCCISLAPGNAHVAARGAGPVPQRRRGGQRRPADPPGDAGRTASRAQARPAYVAYMESLQAVQDLVDEYGMSRLRRLLAGLGAGGDLETAFAAAYGQPFSRWAAAVAAGRARGARNGAGPGRRRWIKRDQGAMQAPPPDMGIYQVKNLASGKIYIGRAPGPEGQARTARGSSSRTTCT